MPYPQIYKNFNAIPGPTYTCNRCGNEGHFVQVCPTNLDPAYDQAPDSSYQCKICFKRGVHYNSICPLNRDPFSINQRRKALASNEEMNVRRASQGRFRGIEDVNPRALLCYEPEGLVYPHRDGSQEMPSRDEVELQEEKDGDMMEGVEENTRPKYSRFIEELAAARIEMTELVHETRPRPTALDMWEDTMEKTVDGWLLAISDGPATDTESAGYDGDEEETLSEVDQYVCSLASGSHTIGTMAMEARGVRGEI
ncbi:hypothetical protein BP6252_04127 [Coleophoma cylindrospora]|uniref:CCHC-type domain-containing protein n=1 Tax=Coleophoma cylindrospora TaxID=1849047 RepID=A0A3D8RZL6_9HELO|nr:hypothetical protein BP6252_04127 [Coleophoma cylindrospora]